MTSILLDACPGCGHRDIVQAFPASLTTDNSLGRLLARAGTPVFVNFDIAEHALSLWSVCAHCALMFARRRPSPEGLAEWYPPLFQLSEERGYNTAPLPEAYLEGKRRGAEALYRTLLPHDVFEGAKSLIHFRTGPGHFLDTVQRNHPDVAVFGLEYFEHPAAFAQGLVGQERVRRISVPEPVNPFAQERFDLVIANHFLTHAHEPAQFLRYLRSLLSETGTLVITNELDHDLSFRSMTAYPRGLNFFHKQLFTRRTLTAFVRAQGLSAVDISQAKYITLLSKPAAAAAMDAGHPAKALSLIRRWRRKHRLYRSLRFAIDPARRLLR